MGNKVESYDWRTCAYCGADYHQWCHSKVIKVDVLGYPEEVDIKCRSCGASYQVQRAILWRIRQLEGTSVVTESVPD